MDNLKKLQISSAVVVILIAIVAAYYFLNLSPMARNTDQRSAADQKSLSVVVEETQPINNILPAPAEFPSSIPIESGRIVESATTNLPGNNVKQLSIAYESTKTVAQKYAEYKAYLEQTGYKVVEGSATAPVRALFGTKADANLSVAVSALAGKTLVQLSYLLK